MRKYWYAGAAVAGGIFLFGAASPAQADLPPSAGTVQPPADEQLTDLLGSTNGVNLENPLRYSSMKDSPLASNPLMQVRPGRNGTDLDQALGTGRPSRESALDDPDLPAAQVVRTLPLRQNSLGTPMDDLSSDRLPARGLPTDRLPIRNLPINSLLGGNNTLPVLGGSSLPLFGDGLGPDGQGPAAQRPTTLPAFDSDDSFPFSARPSFARPSFGRPSSARHSFGRPSLGRPSFARNESGTDGLPLLGGLGGVLPVDGLPQVSPNGTTPDTAGLPQGGTTVQPTATTPAADVPPVTDAPKVQKAPKAADGPDDPRLHEEPIDDEKTKRPFSPDTRPIAGVDQQYK